MLMLLLQTPRILCASTSHYPCTHTHKHTRNLRRIPLPGSHNPGTSSLGEHMVLLGCCNITLASATAGSLHIPIITTILLPHTGVNEQEPPNQPCFNPILSGQKQMPEGDLHAEMGPKPKLNPRNCANKEEKGKFLHAASEGAD